MDGFSVDKVISLLVLLVAVILHEIGHGLAALALGDKTAQRMGRLTLNPIKHIDLFLTIALPAILILSHSPIVFGGAKPVPVDPLNFRNPRRGMMLTAIAGPAVNLVLALTSYLLFRFLRLAEPASGLVVIVWALVLMTLQISILINLVLALFNLIPIPPLDGGRIAVGLLPRSLALPLARLERVGLLLVVLLLASGAVDYLLGPPLEFVIRHVRM